MFARRVVLLLTLSLAAGCHPPATTATPTPTPLPPTETTVAAAPETPEPPAPVWWTPLPPLSLDRLSEVEQQGAAGCMQGIAGADVAPPDLVAAAECFGKHRAYGLEVRALRRLLHEFPNAAEVPSVLVAVGQRFEQLNLRADALDAYSTYLRRFPKHDDARALGERAVCLARSLADAETVRALLHDLERAYGRRGFVTPPDIAFEQLCMGLAPIR